MEVICATASLTVGPDSDFLVTATGTFHGTATGLDAGQCIIESNNGQFAGLSNTTQFGQNGDLHNASNVGDGLALSGATVSLASAGTKNFTLACKEDAGNIFLNDIQMTAIQIGE